MSPPGTAGNRKKYFTLTYNRKSKRERYKADNDRCDANWGERHGVCTNISTYMRDDVGVRRGVKSKQQPEELSKGGVARINTAEILDS